MLDAQPHLPLKVIAPRGELLTQRAGYAVDAAVTAASSGPFAAGTLALRAQRVRRRALAVRQLLLRLGQKLRQSTTARRFRHMRHMRMRRRRRKADGTLKLLGVTVELRSFRGVGDGFAAGGAAARARAGAAR